MHAKKSVFVEKHYQFSSTSEFINQSGYPWVNNIFLGRHTFLLNAENTDQNFSANICSFRSFSKLFRNVHRKATVTIVSKWVLVPFTAPTKLSEQDKVHAASAVPATEPCPLRCWPKSQQTFVIYIGFTLSWSLLSICRPRIIDISDQLSSTYAVNTIDILYMFFFFHYCKNKTIIIHTSHPFTAVSEILFLRICIQFIRIAASAI